MNKVEAPLASATRDRRAVSGEMDAVGGTANRPLAGDRPPDLEAMAWRGFRCDSKGSSIPDEAFDIARGASC